MNPLIVEVGIGALAVAGWGALYGLMLLFTRPGGIDAAPAGQELGTEPPAIVSLIGNGWDLTEDAAEATLLDLGARRYVEFRQLADDPLYTTIHIRQTKPAGLSRYEQRVFDRVSALAVGGVVPLTALTFRDQGQARTWSRHLRAEVVADARARGLSQRRFGPRMVGALVAAAGVAAIVVAGAALHQQTRTGAADPSEAALAYGAVCFIAMTVLAGRPVGEKDTPLGREVAGRWLGVRAWLRAHESFAELPPSAVTVWDRYLAYGAALGATRTASAVLDLGMGDRQRVWSSFGGAWHRVRVRYPRWGFRHGLTSPRLLGWLAILTAVGYALARWWRPLIGDIAEASGDAAWTSWAGLIQAVGLLAGIALLAYGLYGLVRLIVDLAAPVTVTGQVLWIQDWKQTSSRENSPAQPFTFYYAIDDGTADRTTAWALPAEYERASHTGDTVTVTARRWSRRVTELTVIEEGNHARAAGGAAPAVDPDNMVAGLLTTRSGTPARSDAPAGSDARAGSDAPAGVAALAGLAALAPPAVAATLLTAEEVSQALALPVTTGELELPGSISTVQYTNVDTNQVVLMVQATNDIRAQLARPIPQPHTDLPGIGDRAWTDGDRASATKGESTVLLTLTGDGAGRTHHLPWLLQQATSRIPT